MKTFPPYEDVLSAAREVVEEAGPHHIYTKLDHMIAAKAPCLYVHTDEKGENPQPGCIVARILVKLDVMTLEQLRWCEYENAQEVIESRFPGTDGKTTYFLDSLQSYQDSHVPWGDALSRALEDVEWASQP